MRGGDEKCAQNFSQKPGGKRPVGKHRRSWEDSSKTYLNDIQCDGYSLHGAESFLES
jgi:hypothetical protein